MSLSGHSLATPLVEDIDGDKISFRVASCNLDNKVTDAAANFQDERIVVTEQGGKAPSIFFSRASGIKMGELIRVILWGGIVFLL